MLNPFETIAARAPSDYIVCMSLGAKNRYKKAVKIIFPESELIVIWRKSSVLIIHRYVPLGYHARLY